MSTNEQPHFGGSLGNIDSTNPSLPNGFLNENSLHKSNSLNANINNKPFIQPRISSSTSANNTRVPSGRSHDNIMQSAASYEPPGSHMPPPVKVR